MTSFTTLGITLGFGAFVFIVTLIAFGCAVRRRHIAIAPRCTARPKNTIYNPNPNADQACQDRGNPTFGWIWWTMSLSFDTMLRGIPGTGTRKGGLEGALLRVNLDSIILIRFHDLCLKVCALTTFLAITVILPLLRTVSSQCSVSECPTDFEKTTLAMIAPRNSDKERMTHNDTIRLYLIVLCAWVVYCYTMYLVKEEWKENVALRRAFYLESDHHMNRKQELESTSGTMQSMYLDDDDDDDDDDEESNNNSFHRDPWIPHPEQRDTVPNIELYSVLFHNIPALPSEVMDQYNQDDFVRFTKRECIDWQLCVTTAFFDHIVPNQPGFSSSVAAITILPSANQLALAWRKWYVAAGALRKLRYIRTLITSRRHYDIDTISDEDTENKTTSEISASSKNAWADSTLPLSPYSIPAASTTAPTITNNRGNRHYATQDFGIRSEDEILPERYREVFGSHENPEVENEFFKALDYGPEQTAMYTRELAQGAAACCPYGCNDGRLRHIDFQDLLELEKDAVKAVHEANLILLDAQRKAANNDDDDDENDNNSKEKLKKHQKFINNERTEGKMPNVSDGSKGTENLENILPETLQVESKILGNYNNSLDSPAEHRANPKFNAPPVTNSRYRSEILSKERSLHSYQQSIPEQPFTPMAAKLNIEMSNQSLRSRNSQSTQNGATFPSSTDSIASLPPLPRQQLMSSSSNSFPSAKSLPPITSYSSLAFHPTKRSTFSSLSSIRNMPRSSNNHTVTLNDRGKFILKNHDNESVISSHTHNQLAHSVLSTTNNDDESVTSYQTLFPISSQHHPRRRSNASTINSFDRSNLLQRHPSAQWQYYEKIRENDENSRFDDSDSSTSMQPPKTANNGIWTFKIYRPYVLFRFLLRFFRDMFGVKTVVNSLARENTICVVTFTSRQAAVAARHCLADGRGASRWIADKTVPVPPLADAASCDFKTCRGCCRPVTASINKRQKLVRKYLAMCILILLFIFYIFPIMLITELLSDEFLMEIFPALKQYDQSPWGKFLSGEVSGILQGVLMTLFFSVAPQLFKMIANIGSNAHSVITAECQAMKYYWYFMVLNAFSATSILTATLQAFNELRFEESVQQVLTEVAESIPTKVVPAWINWIILRTTVVLPNQYLLQINTFVFYCVGWNCCARCVMGGGPGGQTPYRIYIDSGVVFMCNVALSFAAPLIAPCALLYFVLCVPLWRRNSIYLYRPKFDGGGMRWPFLSDMLLTSLFVSQILLVSMMSLREYYGPAIMAGLSIIVTIIWRKSCHDRYFKAFCDAGLLQTSLLDGWDNTTPSSMEKREDFRRFLVDAHKAAYIPVCIASDTTESLTAQPAIVVPREGDVEPPSVSLSHFSETLHEENEPMESFRPSLKQPGVSVRRMSYMQFNPILGNEPLASTAEV